MCYGQHMVKECCNVSQKQLLNVGESLLYWYHHKQGHHIETNQDVVWSQSDVIKLLDKMF